jgi:hypothetical protein
VILQRAGDWHLLPTYGDPIPGDPDAVNARASNYTSIARAMRNAQLALVAAFDDGGLSGDAIDALRDEALQVADRIGRAEERYQITADALADYVIPLRTARDDSWDLLTAAVAAQEDIVYAEGRLTYWRGEHEDAVAADDTAAATYADGRIRHWEGEAESRHTTLATLGTQLIPIVNTWDTAAHTAADLIDAGADTGDLNDGFWENVDQWFEENPWVDDVMFWVGVIGAALAVVAMFIPGLNLIVIALAVLVIAVTAMQMFSGNKSVAEGLTTIVLTLLPFGIGKIFKPAAAMTAAATRVSTASATAIRASHAGSSVSGMTGPASQAIVASVKSSLPTILGTEGRELVEVIVVSNIRMQSGNLAPSVTALVGPALGIFGINLANEVVPSVADIVIGQSGVLDSLGSWDQQNHDW